MLITVAILLLAPSAQLWERQQPPTLPEFSLRSVPDGRLVSDEEFAGRRSLVFLFDGVDDELIAPMAAELRENQTLLGLMGAGSSRPSCARIQPRSEPSQKHVIGPGR